MKNSFFLSFSLSIAFFYLLLFFAIAIPMEKLVDGLKKRHEGLCMLFSDSSSDLDPYVVAGTILEADQFLYSKRELDFVLQKELLKHTDTFDPDNEGDELMAYARRLRDALKNRIDICSSSFQQR